MEQKSNKENFNAGSIHIKHLFFEQIKEVTKKSLKREINGI